MLRRSSAVFAALILAMSCALLSPAIAEPGETARVNALVACSPDRVAVESGGSVVLRAWANADGGTDRGGRTRYAWDVRVGQLEGEGADVRWVLTGVRAGRYAAAVRLDNGRGPVGEECIVRVIVTRQAAERGLGALSPPPGTRPRETGTAFLLPNQAEAPGYGLYSYLLFGAPPGDGARERYASALEAYLRLIPDLTALEQYVPAAELNVVYVPLRVAPDRQTAPDRMLADYDYARARSLVRLVPGPHRDGPYIVSSLKPLGGVGQPATTPTPYLFQDLSNVPPQLVASWIKEFLNQAAQERFWEERSTQQFALKLRMTVGILATALPEVKKALDTWIAWVR